MTHTLDLTVFNALPAREAEQALLRCCSAPRWASQLASGRPYESVRALCAAADSALTGLTESELDQAMAGHPRIGERVNGAHAASSRYEQRGIVDAAESTVSALAEGNGEYEDRFGHVYLVCADGRDADELLAVLRRRLRNDPETERAQSRAELGKINRIRLCRLLGAEPERGDKEVTR